MKKLISKKRRKKYILIGDNFQFIGNLLEIVEKVEKNERFIWNHIETGKPMKTKYGELYVDRLSE